MRLTHFGHSCVLVELNGSTILFDPGNFFGNPINQWAPTELVSMMVLGVPKERKLDIGLKRIADPNDWWDFGVPISSYLKP